MQLRMDAGDQSRNEQLLVGTNIRRIPAEALVTSGIEVSLAVGGEGIAPLWDDS
jgi:hypothetical protein